MAVTNKLTALGVTRVKEPGRYADGGNLYLQVSDTGTKAWLFRFMLNGKAREMGLGSVNDFSLAEARERARRQRQLLADGIDPIDQRRAQQAEIAVAKAQTVSFANFVNAANASSPESRMTTRVSSPAWSAILALFMAGTAFVGH